MSDVDLRDYRKILLLTDGHSTPFLAKTAISLLRYRPGDVVGVLDREQAGKSCDELFGCGGERPVVASLQDAPCDALFIGIAPPGGRLPASWRDILNEAIGRKIDVVSGLHDFLIRDPQLVDSAARSGSRLIDVRRNDHHEVATCATFRKECLRVHAIGNDCSLGKMVTSLELQRGLIARGHDAGFAATGQTGIMIAGSGMPIDCVVADFVSGAAEQLVLANQDHDFLLIEGQGSLSHPLYSGVTLGLLHGCAPDALVFCYEAGRRLVKGLSGVAIPPLERIFDLSEQMANLRHPCRIIGVAANTRDLNEADAKAEMQRVESELGVPVCDPYRDGTDRLVDAAIELRKSLVAS